MDESMLRNKLSFLIDGYSKSGLSDSISYSDHKLSIGRRGADGGDWFGLAVFSGLFYLSCLIFNNPEYQMKGLLTWIVLVLICYFSLLMECRTDNIITIDFRGEYITLKPRSFLFFWFPVRIIKFDNIQSFEVKAEAASTSDDSGNDYNIYIIRNSGWFLKIGFYYFKEEDGRLSKDLVKILSEMILKRK